MATCGQGKPGNCRACGVWTEEKKLWPRSAFLIGIGYVEEGKAMGLCDACLEKMTKWLAEMRLRYGKVKRLSPVTLERRRTAMKGRVMTEEHRRKISEGNSRPKEQRPVALLTARDLQDEKQRLVRILKGEETIENE